MFYFERYNNHNRSEKHAKKLLPKIDQKVEQLHDVKSYPLAELEFLKQGLQEVIRCRQVLKWTYAYGFYLKDLKMKDLFEFQQENLEKNCDYLHELAEKDLDLFMDMNTLDKAPFYHYKGEFINYA
jgi:ariadne-1